MIEQEIDTQRLTPDQSLSVSELKHLDIFLGEWMTEWRVPAQGQQRTFYGRDTYEWMPGGVSMAHHTYVRINDHDYHSMEIIGSYDATSQSYPTHSYDTKGQEMSLRGRVDDAGVWVFAGDTQCVRLNLSQDGRSMTAYWEQLGEDAHWHHWMDIRYMRET